MAERRKANFASLLAGARAVTEEEVLRFCEQRRKDLVTGDRNVEGLEVVRQLVAYLLTSQKDLRLPRQFVAQLFAILAEPEQGPPALRVLCFLALRELLPSKAVTIGSFQPPVERVQIPHLLALLLAQGDRYNFESQHLDKILNFVSNSADSDLHIPALMCLAGFARWHPQSLRPDSINRLSGILLSSLRNPSLAAAAARGGAKQSSTLMEMDGSKCRDFFTILNVAKSYPPDQTLNIHAFSMLGVWLTRCLRDPASPLSADFKTAVIEYCQRLIDQGLAKIPEDKPLPAADRILIHAAVSESVRLMDLLCQLDAELVPRLVPHIKRLSARATELRHSVHVAVLQFFVSHSELVAIDMEPICANVFGAPFRDKFNDPLCGVVTIDLALDLADKLKRGGAVVKYFPNLLKVIAWNPRTFLGEALELLPSLVSPSNAIEVFHSILDLPCLTVALEMYSSGEVARLSAASSVAGAFFNYILRDEGGLGGTIDRLSDLHTLLQPYSVSARAEATAQIAPIILQGFFELVLSRENYSCIQSLLQAMLDRVSKIFSVGNLVRDIRALLADFLPRMFAKHPNLLYDSNKELLDFVAVVKNCYDGRDTFFAHIVWAIGEYTSPVHDARCETELIHHSDVVLEELTFELNMSLQGANAIPPGLETINIGKLLCVLMTALAKLAANCQDIVPRVRLCLTKMAKQYSESTCLDPKNRRPVVQRALSLCKTLKFPAIAATVLAAPMPSAPQHTDASSAMGLLHCTDMLQS